ncbi:hypothetical protein [Actinomadura sp. SCN-SB]|uniref:hypothetical protein n=1 Tax=Actinomadura sp. SCN-SB TaxID=3373092 RepID=UPI0037534F8B
MSGYDEQPPAWNDPYGPDPYGQAQGWNDPYGPGTQPSWGAYGQPSGYGPPGVPRSGGGAPGSTIAALICNALATGMCCNLLAIPGIITAALAMNRSQTDPNSTRTLTTWSWVIFAVALVLQIALFIVIGVLDAVNGSDYDGV